MESIQAQYPQQVEQYFRSFSFEKYGHGFICNVLYRFRIYRNRAEYDDCYEAGMVAYLYSIHRCAALNCDYTIPYIRKMIRIYVLCALVIADDGRNICRSNGLRQVHLDADSADKFLENLKKNLINVAYIFSAQICIMDIILSWTLLSGTMGGINMPIADILIRSISGYIFVIPGLLLYFMYLQKSGKKQTTHHIETAFIFCYYLIGILTMTGIGKLKPFAPRIVLIPFVDMIRGPIDTILNVILFLPLGFFIPLLYKKYNRISRIALTGFLLSLSIELVQMFGMGATDINDLITNTVGACLGYFIYKSFSKVTKKQFCEKFQANKINDGIEILFFIAYSFLIMITIQPFVIHSLFRLG